MPPEQWCRAERVSLYEIGFDGQGGSAELIEHRSSTCVIGLVAGSKHEEDNLVRDFPNIE